MKYKLLLITCCCVVSFIKLNAQVLAVTNNSYEIGNGAEPLEKDAVVNRKARFFLGYDLGEAAFNKFQSLGSEMGLKFKNTHIFRLSYTNLNLSEEHLASNFAKAVDGENVKGKQVGLEAFYDFPIFYKGLYAAPSVGYYNHQYIHTTLDEYLENSSFTLGTSISFTEVNIFKIKGLYYRLSIPLRFHLTPIDETQLGDATINSSVFDNSIWFFIGYEF